LADILAIPLPLPLVFRSHPQFPSLHLQPPVAVGRSDGKFQINMIFFVGSIFEYGNNGNSKWQTAMKIVKIICKIPINLMLIVRFYKIYFFHTVKYKLDRTNDEPFEQRTEFFK
jgi:hypothetical protein